MLEIQSLYKSFAEADGQVHVLQDLYLSLPTRGSAALLGESGSGKTTLLNLVAGLDKADRGQIVIDSEPTAAFSDSDWNELRRNKLGLVFQQYHLVPTLTVTDNVKLQARLAGNLDASFFDYLLKKLGLDGLRDRLPHQLSGGQQQRVAIARALMHKPKLVLADEPTGNLDEETSGQVIELLVEVTKESNSALLMVTHSLKMASYLQTKFLLRGGSVTEDVSL